MRGAAVFFAFTATIPVLVFALVIVGENRWGWKTDHVRLALTLAWGGLAALTSIAMSSLRK